MNQWRLVVRRVAHTLLRGVVLALSSQGVDNFPSSFSGVLRDCYPVLWAVIGALDPRSDPGGQRTAMRPTRPLAS